MYVAGPARGAARPPPPPAYAHAHARTTARAKKAHLTLGLPRSSNGADALGQCGIIEVVPNTISRDILGREHVNDLYQYFLDKYGDEDSPSFQKV